MDYSKSKTYSKIMWIVYIIIGICAITYLSNQEAKLKTPVIENAGQSNTVTDISSTNEDKKENLVEVYIPTDDDNNSQNNQSDNNRKTNEDTNNNLANKK